MGMQYYITPTPKNFRSMDPREAEANMRGFSPLGEVRPVQLGTAERKSFIPNIPRTSEKTDD